MFGHTNGDIFNVKVAIPYDAFRQVFRNTPILVIEDHTCRIQFGDFITGQIQLPDSIYHTSNIRQHTSIDIIGDFYNAQNNESLIGKEYPDLSCACCCKEITHPQWIDHFLGNEIGRYLDACREMGQKPQIFCCNCLPAIQRNPSVMNHWNEIKAQCTEFTNRLVALEQREKDLIKRERELDEQYQNINIGMSTLK